MFCLFVYRKEYLSYLTSLKDWDDFLSYTSKYLEPIEWIDDPKFLSYELSIPEGIEDAFIDEHGNVYIIYSRHCIDNYQYDYELDYDHYDRHATENEQDAIWKRLSEPALLMQAYFSQYEIKKSSQRGEWYVGAFE